MLDRDASGQIPAMLPSRWPTFLDGTVVDGTVCRNLEPPVLTLGWRSGGRRAEEAGGEYDVQYARGRNRWGEGR